MSEALSLRGGKATPQGKEVPNTKVQEVTVAVNQMNCAAASSVSWIYFTRVLQQRAAFFEENYYAEQIS